jgi:uncharacterized protein (DUF1501 family)
MNRRQFFSSSSSCLLPLLLDKKSLRVFSNSTPLVKSILDTDALSTDRVLVLIYLNGGNDGLNTVIPLDQMSEYQSLRSNIAIPENSALVLQNHINMGLHPSMIGFKNLFTEGKLSIINSVSYPNPNFSHHRSTEIWMTATDSNVQSATGWAGRYLDNRFPNYPAAYPSVEMDDPIALQIGYVTSTALLGPTESMAIALNDPETFKLLIGEATPNIPTDLPCCEAGDLISYIRKQKILSIGYADRIKHAADLGANYATYPVSNGLADQLKIVSRLIHGGLKTKVYLVTQDGYDTHANQVSTTPTTGLHANLLKDLSDAISAFQADLKLQNIEDRVVGMTFSEFGRRAKSNNSNGTDHGVAAPVFVFGNKIKQKVIGNNPDLTDLENNDIKMQIDFRRIYRDILQDWFGVSSQLTNQLLYKDFSTISLFNEYIESVKSGNWLDPSTWSIGRVPKIDENVKINIGHKVIVRSIDRVQCKYLNILGNFETENGAYFKSEGLMN